MSKQRTKNKQTMVHKTIHRKLKIEQQEPYYTPGVNSGAPEVVRVLLKCKLVYSLQVIEIKN